MVWRKDRRDTPSAVAELGVRTIFMDRLGQPRALDHHLEAGIEATVYHPWQ